MRLALLSGAFTLTLAGRRGQRLRGLAARGRAFRVEVRVEIAAVETKILAEFHHWQAVFSIGSNVPVDPPDAYLQKLRLLPQRLLATPEQSLRQRGDDVRDLVALRAE